VVEHLLAKEKVAGSIPVSRFIHWESMATWEEVCKQSKMAKDVLKHTLFLPV
jgi:hypothetical protein